MYTLTKKLDGKKLTQNTLAIRRKLPTVCKNLRGGRTFAQEGHTTGGLRLRMHVVIEYSHVQKETEEEEGGRGGRGGGGKGEGGEGEEGTLLRVYNTCTVVHDFLLQNPTLRLNSDILGFYMVKQPYM